MTEPLTPPYPQSEELVMQPCDLDLIKARGLNADCVSALLLSKHLERERAEIAMHMARSEGA